MGSSQSIDGSENYYNIQPACSGDSTRIFNPNYMPSGYRVPGGYSNVTRDFEGTVVQAPICLRPGETIRYGKIQPSTPFTWAFSGSTYVEPTPKVYKRPEPIYRNPFI